ncbi:MAG: hypothetical protein LBR89_03470 [Holosporales bacterium]|nr:hypothetical protein [Holosporales bacterium]
MCITTLIVAFFTLELANRHMRYEFLVKGDVCIAFDRKEETLKVIGIKGCISIPLNKTPEQQIREQVEAELGKQAKKGLVHKSNDADDNEE